MEGRSVVARRELGRGRSGWVSERSGGELDGEVMVRAVRLSGGSLVIEVEDEGGEMEVFELNPAAVDDLRAVLA